MRVIEFDSLQTVVLGLAWLEVARWLVRHTPGLGKSNIPTPVIGGVLGSLMVALARSYYDVEVHFASALTDFMLLVFFTSVGSMTVGMASMDKVASRYGPSPKAFLLITLAGSFFVDPANAVIVQAMLKLPIFH